MPDKKTDVSLKCVAWSDHMYFVLTECIYGLKFDHNHNPPQYLNECVVILIAYVTMVEKSGHNLCIFKGALRLARFGQHIQKWPIRAYIGGHLAFYFKLNFKQVINVL